MHLLIFQIDFYELNIFAFPFGVVQSVVGLSEFAPPSLTGIKDVLVGFVFFDQVLLAGLLVIFLNAALLYLNALQLLFVLLFQNDFVSTRLQGIHRFSFTINVVPRGKSVDSVEVVLFVGVVD